MGAGVAFAFGFADGTRMNNAFDAHRLLHFADRSRRKHDLEQALLAAHSTDCLNLSDRAVLSDIAAETGPDRAAALAVLRNRRFADAEPEAGVFWTSRGFQGVTRGLFPAPTGVRRPGRRDLHEHSGAAEPVAGLGKCSTLATLSR